MKQKYIFYIISFSILLFSLPLQTLAEAQTRERLNIAEIEMQRQKIEEKRDLIAEEWPLKSSNIEINLPQQLQLRENITEQFQEQKNIFQGYMLEIKEGLSDQVKDEIKARQKQLIEESKKQIKNYKEEMRLRIQEMKIEKAKEMITYKEELRQYLQGLWDQKKIDKSEEFSDKINHLNEVYSDKYSGRLLALETVIDKMELRAEIMELDGKDISEVLVCISAARQTILNAYEDISEQKNKIYKVEIEEGEAPGLMFQATLRELKEDHKLLRENIMKPVIGALKECLSALQETRNQVSEVIEEVEEAEKNNEEIVE